MTLGDDSWVVKKQDCGCNSQLKIEINGWFLLYSHDKDAL